jgi:hypothetical protein
MIWGMAQLYRLVASFLAACFSTLLALNKVGRMLIGTLIISRK